MKKQYRRLAAACLCAAVLFTTFDIGGIYDSCQVQAAKKDDLKQQNEDDQNKLDDVNDRMNELSEEQEGIDAEITALSNEIAEIMASISLLEEVEAKKAQIEQAKLDLAEAQRIEREQYESMKVRVKAMYESGQTSFLDIIFNSSSMEEMLNKADYVEKMQEYDRKMFTNYQIARQNVEDLKENLEIDSVEEARAELETISADYALQISKAKQQAEVYKSQIKQRNAQIKQIEEAERKAAEEAARKKAEEERRRKEEEAKKNNNKNNSSNSSNSTTTTPPASGTAAVNKDAIMAAKGGAQGKEVAVFACGFVGNPYVAGGTSLTNGADCSGFTQSVYKSFGYSIPRSSTSQRSAGREVSYADAEPGDIICYPGHVAIYIGNGKIVHASSAKTGIKISNALYREILCVRRVV